MLFKFKQFDLLMSDQVFKVGTDATLLGGLFQAEHKEGRLADIGCGTGVISLMIAQRYPQLSITGIDINPDAIELTDINFQRSPFNNPLKTWQGDLNQYSHDQSYDYIVTNPPYHLEDAQSQHPVLAQAKSSSSLSQKHLIRFVDTHLHQNGQFWVIATVPYMDRLTSELKAIHLYPQKEYSVRHHDHSRISRKILAFSRKERPVEQETIIIYEDGRQFSQQAKKILGAYLTVI